MVMDALSPDAHRHCKLTLDLRGTDGVQPIDREENLSKVRTAVKRAFDRSSDVPKRDDPGARRSEGAPDRSARRALRSRDLEKTVAKSAPRGHALRMSVNRQIHLACEAHELWGYLWGEV